MPRPTHQNAPTASRVGERRRDWQGRGRGIAAASSALWFLSIAAILSSIGCAATNSPMAGASSNSASDPASDAAPAPMRAVIGATAPSLAGLSLVSGELPSNWRALRGRPIILEFGAPWCGVCALVHQRMNEWHQQWGSYGVEVIGVVAETPEEARRYVQRFGIQYPVATDIKKTTFRAYGISAVPTVLLIDQNGIIVDATTGYFSKRLVHMERELTALIGQNQAPEPGE